MNKKSFFVLSSTLLLQAVAASVFAQNDYVDLGLSVQWATCNLGADKPEDYGNYYAWAETKPKNSYTWENYRYFDPSEQDSVSKYHIGEVTYQRRYDYIGTLTQKEYIPADMNTKCFEPMDDAATSLMGNDWRMPTADELWELKNLCEWQYINRIDSCGYIITSKVPGYTSNSIFLPCTNVNTNIPDNWPSTSATYLTSDLSSRSVNNCVALSFSEYEIGTTDEVDLNTGWVDNRGMLAGIKWAKIHIEAYSRESGAFVRAVCPK